MSWMEMHQELRDHPKVRKLARMMNWDYCHALGHLQYFWLWCLQHAMDGDLRKYDEEQVAEAAGVEANKAKQFIEAMVNCGNGLDDDGNRTVSGFIDREPYFRVHDWVKYVGRYLELRYRNTDPGKVKQIQASYKPMKIIAKLETEAPIAPIQPEPILPEKPVIEKKGLDEKFFNEMWECYPNKSGKKQAIRHFNASVKTIQDFQDMHKAMQNYLKCERVVKGFIQDGSRFFNNWRDWINPTPAMMGNLAPGSGVKGEAGKYAEMESK